MRILRIYTGDDNQSHFEDLDIPLEESRYGQLSSAVPTQGVMFRVTPTGAELAFHTAPQRQFVITLEGEVEIECGDGAKQRLGPGGIMLADDTTGQGHITREISGPRRSLFLPLPEAFDIAPWRVDS